MRTLLGVGSLVASSLFLWFVYQQTVVEASFGPAAMFGSVGLALVTLVLVLMTVLAGSRFRPMVGNLLLAGVSALGTFLSMDLLAGAALIKPLSPPLVPDGRRHHRLVPDSQSEITQRDFSYIQL